MKNINLKNTLIAEIIQLFAKMASVDGKVTDEEREYINKYFKTLYPENFAQVLYKEFEKAVETSIKTDTLLSNIDRRLNNDDKIFLIVKLIELMAADDVDEKEKKLLYYIADKFNIPNDNVNFFIKTISGNEKEETFIATTTPYKFLIISNNQKTGNVLLPYSDLELLIINSGKSFIIIQKDKNNNIKINDKQVISHFATKIPQYARITINNEYELYYQDLKYYFGNLESSKSTFYLSENNNDIELNAVETETNVIICEKEKSKIFLTPIKEEKLEINGVKVTKKTNVNFNDEIFCANYKINLRTLIFQSFFQTSENIKLSQSNISKFTIGNNLESTIYIEDDYDKLWDCQVELKNNSYYIEVKQCPYNVFINDKAIKRRIKVNINDKIRIRNSVISYNTTKKIFEKKDFGFNNFIAQGLQYQFKDKTTGLDKISFTAKRGELLGIMGASGSGKSTLLNIINGFYKPQKGKVLADEYDIHQNIGLFSNYLSYVPQDDLLFENLTVFENLYYNAKLRFPGTTRNIGKLVDKVLNDIGLYEKRNIKVGNPLNKTLSGGERKRVNIGLELLADSNIILLDEPTSGLSSKDSERILKLLQNLSFEGKIIFVVIHQPSVKLYELFNKLILLDKGGKLAYFGSPFAALDYFRKYSDKDENSENEHTFLDPDFLLDTIEQQISDIDGTPLPIRKYSPEFWQNEFKKHFEKLSIIEKNEKNDTIPKKPKKSIIDHFLISKTLLQRNFINKLRDKSNLIITFFLPPLLGLFVGGILHYTPGGEYTFFENKHIGTFLFLSMLISVFLGLTSSVEEIIKDQNILRREKMLKISNLSYFNSKVLTLIPFALIQNFLFVFVGYFILEGKEFYIVYTVILTIVSFCGISLGLLISSIPKLTSKAAVNIIPIVLIPQIVFGGALIQYQEMNKQLVIDQNSPVPEICQIMPSRWGFEALVTYLAYNNSYKAIESLDNKLTNINNKISETEDGAALDKLLNDRINLRNEIDTFKTKFHDTHGNFDISAAIDIDANLEYKNFIEGKTTVYPMFIAKKKLPIINKEVSTPLYNSIVLIIISLIINIITLIIFKLRFK